MLSKKLQYVLKSSQLSGEGGIVNFLEVRVHVLACIQWCSQDCSQAVSGLVLLRHPQYSILIVHQGCEEFSRHGTRRGVWVPEGHKTS